MKSAQIIKIKEKLSIVDLPDPKPRDTQVLVRIEASGVCHSDIHLWEGGYEGAAGTFLKVEDRGVKFPITPGHEISGKIEAIGDSVSGFNVGDKVVVYPWIGEGSCPACRVGQENLCDTPRTIGIYRDGGYSELVLVPNFRYLVKIDNLDVNSSASLACSGLTAYNAVKKATVGPGESIVIIGAGGLGLMSVQIARATTNSRIVVVDVDDKRLAEAKKLGAHEVVNSSKSDAVQEIKNLTNALGAEAVVDFVNNNRTAPVAINMLRKRGKLVMVGLFGGALELSLPVIPLRGFTITGAYTGSFNDLVELVNLSKTGAMKSVVNRTYKLDDANQALEDLRAGKIVGRAVLNPNN
ncbi:MAG TPA: alcohol dehydrogenase [Nitrososphaeraceae archaeon]